VEEVVMRKRTLALSAVAIAAAVSVAGLGAANAVAPKYGKCKPTGKFNSVKLKTHKQNVLIVGLTSLAPRTYAGDTLASVNDGYNYCLAANIAYRAGLAKIELKKVDFAQLIVGRLSGFDVAMDDFYIKPEREAKIDFSIPYGHSWSAVVGLSDTPLRKSEMKGLKFGVTLGSVQQKWLDEKLKPKQQYATFDDPPTMFAALRAKQIDAALIDMPVALPAGMQSKGVLKVYAQIKAGGLVGIIMQQPSPNRAAVNKIVREILKNGTLKSLEKKYLYSAYGGVDPDSFAVWG
jgi:polar amino acid transport system substrate-binding protein